MRDTKKYQYMKANITKTKNNIKGLLSQSDQFNVKKSNLLFLHLVMS